MGLVLEGYVEQIILTDCELSIVVLPVITKLLVIRLILVCT